MSMDQASILASYLVGEEIWAKEIERMKLERQKASEKGVQEITSKWKRMRAGCRRCAKFCDFENDHLALRIT